MKNPNDRDMPPPDRLLTTRDVATRLGMTPEGVRQRIRRGWVPSIKLGRQFRVWDSVLQAYLKSLPDGRAKDGDA